MESGGRDDHRCADERSFLPRSAVSFNYYSTAKPRVTTLSSDPRSSPQSTESKAILPALPPAPRRDYGARVVVQPSAKRLIGVVTRRHWRVTTQHRRKPPHAKRFTCVDLHADGAIGTPVVMPRNSRVTTHSRSIGLFTPSAPRFITCK